MVVVYLHSSRNTNQNRDLLWGRYQVVGTVDRCKSREAKDWSEKGLRRDRFEKPRVNQRVNQNKKPTVGYTFLHQKQSKQGLQRCPQTNLTR